MKASSRTPEVIPFPWKDYLLAAFVAPIALLFLFGVIIQGFEMLCTEPPAAAPGSPGRKWSGRLWRLRYLPGLLPFMAVLVFAPQGRTALALLTAAIKSVGLGGSYVLIALLALALLYLPLRLFLRYPPAEEGPGVSVSLDLGGTPRGAGG